ncbi:ferredoxin [Haloarcula halophila]|uniref:ferredoxin n=1 Tax=Haloarcula TaxID=2237 RepID=UPI0023E411CD|nr:ferredoxin [Halomicroarcula sp. DFY41]
MTTEYQVRLDRAACDGIFACLVRDDRFVEAEDGLAAIEGGEDTLGDHDDGSQLVTFDDDRLEAAQQAASACPVDAIDVVLEGADE